MWTEQGWNAYPFHANSEFFADFGAYNVQIRLPSAWQTAGTGLPTAAVDNGDGTQTVTYQAHNVIDFAWTASPNLREATRKVGSVEIRYVYLPEHDWTVARELYVAEKAVTDYAKWFGPYPYPRLTVVDTTTSAMMKECQMQLSGPWPPYHFVHRLTRGAHVAHTAVSSEKATPTVVMQPAMA